MTEDIPAGLEKAPAKSGRKHSFLLLFLLLGLSFACGAGIQYFLPTSMGLWQIPSKWPAKVLELQARIERLEKAGETPGAPLASLPARETDEIKKIKEDFAAFSETVSSLKDRLAQSAENTDVLGRKTQSGLATVLAFMEMQKKALAGRPFEKERQILVRILQPDEESAALLAGLEPVAASGAETPEALRAEWDKLSLEAQTALRRAAAQTWQDRVAVALESLVSIRSLKAQAGQSLIFAEVDLDLARGNLRGALEKMASFPAEAQESLAPWRAKLEARVKAEDAMDSFVDLLISRGQKETAQPEGKEAPSESAFEAKP